MAPAKVKAANPPNDTGRRFSVQMEQRIHSGKKLNVPEPIQNIKVDEIQPAKVKSVLKGITPVKGTRQERLNSTIVIQRHSMICPSLEKLQGKHVHNSEENKPKLGMQRGPSTPLPGISYVADGFEWKESETIQAKVVQEFIDFLGCITDLLQLVHTLPTDWLRSSTPLPGDVIRELRGGKRKRIGRIQAFDQSLKESTATLSSSLERCFSGTKKEVVYGKRVLPKLPRQHTLRTHNAQDVAMDIEKILGRKPAHPVWHSVLLEKKHTKTLEQSHKKEDNTLFSTGDCVLKNYLHRDTFDTKDHTMSNDQVLGASMKYLKSKKAFRPKEPYKTQFDMVHAYLDGYVDLAEHRAYMLSMEPHWYADLLKRALEVNVVLTEGVKGAFRKLGRFYHNSDEAHIVYADAKMCFLTQSLAVWDVTRLLMQRAVVFILQDILKVNDAHEVLARWMSARRLPYMVVPPVMSTYSASMLDLEKTDHDKESAKARTANNIRKRSARRGDSIGHKSQVEVNTLNLNKSPKTASRVASNIQKVVSIKGIRQ